MESFRYKHLVMSFITKSIDQLSQETLLQTLIAAMLLYHYEVEYSGIRMHPAIS